MALLVRSVEGPAAVRGGEKARYRVSTFNRANPSAAEKRRINWLVEADGAELERHLAHGDSLTLDVRDELAGKRLLVMPYMNSPTPAVSAITLVRPGAGRILRDGLAALRREFADILAGPPADGLADRALADRVAGLKFAADDLLDSVDGLLDDETDDNGGPGARRLAIVVGHTAARPGARAVAPIAQNEYPFNREVARRIEQTAANRGIAARVFLRDGVGIAGAYQAAAAFQPHAIIELHFNSFSNPAVRGTETLCDAASAPAKQLAAAVQAAMVRALDRGGSADRGVKQLGPGDRGHRNVTEAPSVPSVLVEPFFGSSEADCRLVADRLAAYSEALVTGFEAFVTAG